MTSRLRTGTSILGVSAGLVLCLLFCLAVTDAARGQAAAGPAVHNCSTTGLRFSEKQEGVTLGVAVANLRAKAVSCGDARSLASRVARDILGESKIPRRIAGLTLVLKKPCAGCTPDTQVSARSGERAITFTVRGGA
jgi:hypothetical protein